jgi:hypothetical protein
MGFLQGTQGVLPTSCQPFLYSTNHFGVTTWCSPWVRNPPFLHCGTTRPPGTKKRRLDSCCPGGGRLHSLKFMDHLSSTTILRWLSVAFGGADSQKESSPWAKHKKNPENIWIKMRHPWTHKAPCPCVYCKRIQLGWCCDHVTQVAQPFSHPTNFWILSNVGYRTEMPLFTITGQLVSHDIYRYTNLLSVTISPKMEKI